MRRIDVFLCSSVINAVLFFTSATQAQGPLGPPGSPASTMKTLEQIEPRTLISSLPYIITAPGSYYVTSNLTGSAASNGVTISASDVTLDLNGFTLYGGPGTLAGIDVPSSQENISIRNGTIRNWGQRGVDALNAQNSTVQNIHIITNGWEGAFKDGLQIGAHSIISKCVSRANQSDGITVSSGCTVSDCTASFNGGNGIAAGLGSTINDCTATSNGGLGISTGDGSSLSRCAAKENRFDGLSVGAGSTVSECSASLNLGNGIFASHGSTVSMCASRNNVGDGFVILGGCSLTKCTASYNGGDGVECSDKCHVSDNVCDFNGFQLGGAGVHAKGTENRVERNVLMSSDIGLFIIGGRNFILENTVKGNSDNYDIAPSNSVNLILSEIPESIEWPSHVRLEGTLYGTSGEDGITIGSEDVTIDLGGHALIGVLGSNSAIDDDGNQQNLHVYNGIIRDWGFGGIIVSGTSNCLIENVTAERCSTAGGISSGILVGNDSRVVRCFARSHTGAGISAGGGSVIESCTATENLRGGITSGDGSTIRDCAARKNGSIFSSYNIAAGEGTQIINCSASYSEGTGIGTTASSAYPMVGVSIIDCNVYNNRDGIWIGQDCRVTGNHSFNNSRDGIRVNTDDNVIDSNSFSDNQVGVNVGASAGNIVTRNTVTGNETNFIVSAGNHVATIITTPGTNFMTDQAWANFEF